MPFLLTSSLSSPLLLPGEGSPIALLLREQLASPGSARRQLFSPGSKKPTTPIKLLPPGGSVSGSTPTRPIPIAPKPTVGAAVGGGGGVTVTLLRDFLQQQQGNICQQLGASPAKSSVGSSPGMFDFTSPLKLSVSMASAGTQTSPCRPISTAVQLPTGGNFSSPAKSLSLSSIAQVCV